MRPRSAMSPAPSGSLALLRVELADALEIRDALIFDFYPGLPHVSFNQVSLPLHP